MGEGLPLYIQKLGHDLEEIRVRALENIISKLNRGLLTPEILLDQPDLFHHLVNWFRQPTSPCRSKVLNLILRLCKEEEGVIHRFLRHDPELKIIRSKVQNDEKVVFQELCGLAKITSEIGTSPNEVSKCNSNDSNLEHHDSNKGQHCNFTFDSLEKSATISNWSPNQASKTLPYSISDKPRSAESNKPAVWPCLHLDQADASVLNTVYSSLRDPAQSAQAIYFFTTVVLHDFPPQVFLHNTAIISALFDLFANDSCDEYLLKCFQNLILSLIKHFNYHIDPVIISTNVSKASPQFIDLGAGGDSIINNVTSTTSNVTNKSTAASVSMEDFCGSLLERLGVLIPGLLNLITLCIPDFNSFWTETNPKYNFLKASINSTFNKIASVLNSSKSVNGISRLEAQLSVYKILKAMIPLEASMVIIPKELQGCLARNLLDPIIYLLFPDIHKLFLSYVQVFKYQNKSVYDEYEELGKSLEAGAFFLNNSIDLNMNEILTLLQKSLIGLEFHQQYRLIPLFVDLLTSKYTLEPSQLEEAQEIMLHLLSSSDDHVKAAAYESCYETITKYLGPGKCLSKDDPLPRLAFIINCKALTEIVSFGLTSEDHQLSKWSESIMTLILKCQILLTTTSWRWLINELSPVLPLLQAFSSQSTVLGRTIVSILDPDMSKLVHLNEIQVLTGNLRLMFSKDISIYEEGKLRLFYLLEIPTKLCGVTNPLNFAEDSLQGKSNPSNSYGEESLLRVLEVISSCPESDRSLIKSALTQLSLITEDPTLHIIFLDNNGLNLVTKFLYSCIDDMEDDSVLFYTPLVVILKNLARHSIHLRLDFSLNYNLFSYILKGLFLFNTEWRLQRDVAQLLALMAYADVILTTPETVSFPHVLVTRIKIPFEPISHAKISQYTIPSKKSRVLGNKTVEKALALRWCIAQYKGGVHEAVTKDLKDLPQAPLLVISLHSFKDLTESHIPNNVRALLDSLANANCHKAASDAIFELNRYLRIKDMIRNEEELNSLPWETSFLRYLTTLPASVQDQSLLLAIIRILTTVIEFLPRQNKWISELFKDPSSVLCALLTQILVADTTPLDKELSVELLTLLEVCLQRNAVGWDHTLKVLVQSLVQSHTHKFYSLAIMDKLLTCLLKMTSFKLVFSPKPLWQLMNAFHCASPDSYMGITITRLTVLCLSSLLSLKPKARSKDWMTEECKWLTNLLASRDLIVKSATLELTSGLCYDSSTTNSVLSILPSLWETVFNILLDHNEASLAREQAAIVCSNIISTTQNKSFVKECSNSGLFGCLALIAARFNFHLCTDQDAFFQHYMAHSITNQSSEQFDDCVSSISTASLLTASCNLVLNLMLKDKEEITKPAVSQGFIHELFRQTTKWNMCKTICRQETVNMYTSVCKLLVYYTEQTSAVIKDCVPVLVFLLQKSTYTKDLDRCSLTIQIVHLLGSIVNNQADVNVILTKEAMDSICDVVKDRNTSLQIETAVSIAHLAPYLTSDANVELINGLKGNGLAERTLLAGVLGTSHAATQAALEKGLLESLITRLKETYIELAVIPPDIPRNKKANVALYNVWVDINLLTNFLAGCVEAKEKCAQLGLADAIHKIWAWCLLDTGLLNSLLQVLINFTADSLQAAATLVLTSTMAGVGQRKTPTSNSLLHAVMTLHSKEVYGNDIKKLVLELMIHACQAQECRIVMNKSNMLNDFLKLEQQKKSYALEELEVSWLEFLEVYSSYIDGQTALMKNEDVLNYISSFISGNKQQSRMCAISLIRNLVFNPVNKQKFIASDKLLKALSELLLDDSAIERELQDITLITWYLAANSQRGKNSVKSVGLVSRLKLVISKNPESELMSLFSNISEIIKS